MNTENYSNNIAGINTLWMFRFVGQYPKPYGAPREHPDVELLFPSPINKGRWLVVHLNEQNKDLRTIEQFQRLCDEAKKRCDEQITIRGNPEEKKATLGHEIDNLAQLLVYFAEVMRNAKKRQPNPPDSPPS